MAAVSPQENPVTTCGLHIGLPKTGTTTLQLNLFAQHPEIEYLGIFVGKTATSIRRRLHHCRDAEIHEFMQEILWEHRFQPDLDKCRELFQKHIEPEFERGRIPVWSWESLADDIWVNRWIRAENLRQALGPCRVIITIRHPMDLLESWYFHMLKRENVNKGPRNKRAIPHQLLGILRGELGWPAHYETINEWCEREFEGEIQPHLDYARTIKLYGEIFGREAVRVMVFEDLEADAESYIRSVCCHLGVDPEQGVSLTKSKHENRRWTRKQLQNLKGINDSFWRSLLFRFSHRWQRHRMVGFKPNHPLRDGSPARARLSDGWRERVEDVTREGNRWLAEEYGLPLEHYGYPL